MSRIVTSRAELVAIHERLKAVLSLGAGGAWAYADGWDDAKVASAAAPRLTSHHVRNLRIQLFGEIAKPSKIPVDVLTRLEQLELRATRQDQLLTELYARLGEDVPRP